MSSLQRNEKYNVILTGEQLAFVYLLASKTNGGWPSKSDLYSHLCYLFADCVPDQIEISDLHSHKKAINDWLDSEFKKNLDPTNTLDLTR